MKARKVKTRRGTIVVPSPAYRGLTALRHRHARERAEWEPVVLDLMLMMTAEVSLANLVTPAKRPRTMPMTKAVTTIETRIRRELARAKTIFRKERAHNEALCVRHRGACMCRHRVLLALLTRNHAIRRGIEVEVAEEHVQTLFHELDRRLLPVLGRRQAEVPS